MEHWLHHSHTFGGKSRAAHAVWAAFGDSVKNYVEPRCSGQSQSFGCLPVRFVVLFVDQFFSCLARFRAATHWSWKVARCIDKWSALLSISKLSRASFSLFSSRWWMQKPAGIGPFSSSHTTCARSLHLFGSAIFTHARCSLPRLCRVLIATDPMGSRLDAGAPAMNCPSAFFMRHFRLKLRSWQADGSGYAKSAEAIANAKSETLWCSPHCVPARGAAFNDGLFAGVVNG